MKTTVSLIALLITLSSVSFAATERVEVTFENSDKYTDIEYNSGSRKKFTQRLFKAWKKYLNDEALKILPENYTLKISFTDIDLAGTYILGGVDDPRIVRDIDFPRLKFNYQLLNGDRLVKKAEVSLKDMNFLRNDVSHRRTFEPYYHEKRLLRRWIKKELKPLVGS